MTGASGSGDGEPGTLPKDETGTGVEDAERLFLCVH